MASSRSCIQLSDLFACEPFESPHYRRRQCEKRSHNRILKIDLIAKSVFQFCQLNLAIKCFYLAHRKHHRFGRSPVEPQSLTVSWSKKTKTTDKRFAHSFHNSPRVVQSPNSISLLLLFSALSSPLVDSCCFFLWTKIKLKWLWSRFCHHHRSIKSMNCAQHFSQNWIDSVHHVQVIRVSFGPAIKIQVIRRRQCSRCVREWPR